jgi:predicted MFS family arabinose efflux permease
MYGNAQSHIGEWSDSNNRVRVRQARMRMLESRTTNAAVTAVAVQLGIMFIGAILPTPLYPLYREAFGFSGVTLTLIYATYVLGNLAALLFFGRLADQIGRRSASLPAVAVGIVSAALFAAAQSTEWLFAARGLSGFSTGLAAGAATAWIAELYTGSDKSRAARIASGANFLGCAAGPLIGGLFAQFAVAPLRLPYLAFMVLLCGAAGAILLPRETVTQPKPLREVELRLRIGVPPGIRLQFVSPAVTGFATFSLIGFYAALIPSLLGETLHQSAPLIAGVVVGELFLIAAVAILASGALASQTATLTALLLLPPSVWILVGAEVAHSLALLLFAAAVGGLAGGLGYRGSLEVINRIAPADRRSEVVSAYMIALFAGNSVPVIGIGFLSAATTALTAHVVFAAVLTVLAGIAMLTGLKYAPHK